MKRLPGRPPRVLIVDDDPTMRLLVRTTLEQGGMAVIEGGDGVAALAAFQEHCPDIVLLDVMMPKMDGFAVCRALRGLPGGEHIPVLMLTGLDDADSIEQAYEAGATDFITKPITWPLLSHRVRYMLRSSRALLDLAESQARLASAQRIASLGHWEWSVLDHQLSCSEEVSRICGWPPGDPPPGPFLTAVHPEDRECVRQTVTEALVTCRPFAVEFRMLGPDASERIVCAQGEARIDATGRVTALAGTLQDITQRRRAEEQIHYLSFYDSLTGLPNRQRFAELFGHARARAQRSGEILAILSLDLDGFRYVNDTLGHDAGDRLLHEAAGRLRRCLRDRDSTAANHDVARLGGDEFTVLFGTRGEVQDVHLCARRLLDAIDLPFALDGHHDITVTASMGIAVYPADGVEFDVLLKHANSALHHAQSLGRNTCQFYTQSMNAAARERLQLENGLRRALERDEFELYYQPKLELRTGQLSGVEALIRWRHPELGMIPPDRFIPVAEETGLISPIGEWVLRTACAQATAWHTAGNSDLSVAVNVSAGQFRQDLALLVGDVLTETGLDPGRLELELTESLLMVGTDAAAQTLRQLKAMGVTITMDDFGTGYSSLSYLKRFPIDVVKIDQSFIQDAVDRPDDASITKAIIAMARSLNIKTVAEGVETRDQLVFLATHGCDAVQGYYVSRPLPAPHMAAVLSDARRVVTDGHEQTRLALLGFQRIVVAQPHAAAPGLPALDAAAG